MNVFRVAPPKTPVVSNSNPGCLLPLGAFPQSHQWVKLLELPHPLSYDEALLLCPQSEDEWVVWIPDCGEAILQRTQ